MALGQSLRMVLARPHPAAKPFLIGGAAVALLGGALLGGFLFWLGVAFTLFCLYFFRDPERIPPARPGLVLAPADGHVVSVMPAKPPVELGMGEETRWRIAIFLSPRQIPERQSGQGK
jgi:phosphatidylserine decarboxylase